MSSSKTKMIAVREETWRSLSEMGTLKDSFDSVISKLIASAGPSFAGPDQQKAVQSPTHSRSGTHKNG